MSKRLARNKTAALEFDTVVVGGGVAGLYCSWKLSQRQPAPRVGLFEGLDRFGGRIETEKFGPFLAEFGPMRFEKPGQEKLMKLLDDLQLTTVDFAPYQAERPDFPVYDLRDIEKGPPPFDTRYTTLELMRLGIIRILSRTKWRSPGNPDNPRDVRHDVWLKSLTETDYAEMRRDAEYDGEHLRDRGFWNALSDVLSHQALMKIRDLGTFYHLIPENPNAIEWIIFWLRGLNPKDRLVSVSGGSGRISERLLEEIKNRKVPIYPEHTLAGITPGPDGGVLLEFYKKNKEPVSVRTKHLILGLPKSPIKKLGNYFGPQTKKDIDAVFGFPLLKCFFLVDNPWWDQNTRPQTRASLIPTREVHYYRKGNQGLVLLYTDRPATEYWKVYVQKEIHDRAEINGDRRLVKQFSRYLAKDIETEIRKHPAVDMIAATMGSPKHALAAAVEALSPVAYSEFSGLKAEDIGSLSLLLQLIQDGDSVETLAERLAERVVKFGIRDWSRDPYGAACHTWRPGVKTWEVLGRLKAFSLSNKDADPKNIHICGEAYSDYNGFIEGALRTADDVLDTIP